MSANVDVLVSIGCDYLTATAKDREAASSLHSAGSVLFMDQRANGNEAKAWGMHGFAGWSCGSVQVGTRKEEVCVRLSSDAAFNSWREVVQHAQNVSRIDLQATLRVVQDVEGLIDRYKRAARRDSEKGHNKKRVRWVQEHHGGYTLYLGNRGSNVFGRIYDKHSESKLDQYRDCVRFECQYQNKLAKFVATELSALPSPMSRIASYVSQFFLGRGVRLELPYKDTARYSCSRPRSDVEKHLEWLTNSVRPCVGRLIADGHGEAVFRALGLIVDDAQPVGPLGPT